MKNIYIIQNSNLSFDMDIEKIYSPNKYFLLLIVNPFSFKKLNTRRQENLFQKIWVIDDFNFDYLKELITHHQHNNPLPLQIITNAEEAITLCGQLRVFFNNETLNFDRFKNKLVMKEMLNKEKILTPKHILFDKQLYQNQPTVYVNHILEKLDFPFLVKPIDSMGCIGIERISSVKELINWCNAAILTQNQYEIDEFISGKVYNCDSFIKNNKIIFTQISQCSNSCYDFICGSTKGTIALPPSDSLSKRLSAYTKKVHDALKTPHAGVTHLEIILTNTNQLYFIEIGYRSPGILIPAMYKKFLNIDTIESHILLQIDDDFNLKIEHKYYSAWIAFPTKNGKLIRKNTPVIQSHYKLDWTKKIGDQMSQPKCGRDYVGKALLWNSNYLQLKNDFNYVNSFQFYDIESA